MVQHSTNASAIVISSNSTVIEYVNVTSTFNSDVVTTNTSTSSFVINAVEGSQIKKFSGNIIFTASKRPIEFGSGDDNDSRQLIKMVIGLTNEIVPDSEPFGA
jgi:hypothetical protein